MNDIFKRLKKVFNTFDNYNCFVCSSSNPIGLKLDIKFNDDTAYSIFNLSIFTLVSRQSFMEEFRPQLSMRLVSGQCLILESGLDLHKN